MIFENTDLNLVETFDQRDPLAKFRDAFVIDDPNLIYLDGNSLGRLPKQSVAVMRDAVEEAWGKRLIRIWNDGWVHTPVRSGARIAPLYTTFEEIYRALDRMRGIVEEKIYERYSNEKPSVT